MSKENVCRHPTCSPLFAGIYSHTKDCLTNHILPNLFYHFASSVYEKKEGLDFKGEEVIKTLISKIGEYVWIPNIISWHFIFNIPNYLSHRTPTSLSPTKEEEEEKEEKENFSFQTMCIGQCFILKLQSMDKDIRGESVELNDTYTPPSPQPFFTSPHSSDGVLKRTIPTAMNKSPAMGYGGSYGVYSRDLTSFRKKRTLNKLWNSYSRVREIYTPLFFLLFDTQKK